MKTKSSLISAFQLVSISAFILASISAFSGGIRMIISPGGYTVPQSGMDLGPGIFFLVTTNAPGSWTVAVDTNALAAWGLGVFGGGGNANTNGTPQSWNGTNTFTNPSNTFAGTFTGSGANLFDIPLSGLQSGGTLNVSNLTVGTVTGNGAGVTNVPGTTITIASNLTLNATLNANGTTNYSIGGLPAANSNNFSGSLNYGQLDRVPDFLLSVPVGATNTFTPTNDTTWFQPKSAILSGIVTAPLTNAATFAPSNSTAFLASGTGGNKDAGSVTNIPTTGLSITITNTGNTNLGTAWGKFRDVNGNPFWVLGITNQP
jgi:hypothetical protein